MFSVAALIAFIQLVLVGCTSGSSGQPAISFSRLPITHMAVALADTDNIQVHHYNLGDAGMVNAVGRPIPAPLTGIIAVPNIPGPHPLVVFLHGQMPFESIHDPVYEGFDYAVQQMAAQGYAAISININVNYSLDFGESTADEWAYEIFNRHIAALEHPEDYADLRDLNLEGQLDLNNIHLVGHSRGGEVADIIYRRNMAAGINNIKSIVLVAGTVGIFDEARPDIPIGIILPELDGDVANLAQLVFDENLENAPQRTAITNLVFLRNANHNFFSRAFIPDDRFSGLGYADLRPEYQTDWLTRDQQEDFLVKYLTAFYHCVAIPSVEPVETTVSVETTGAVSPTPTDCSTFDPTQPQPATIGGFPVIASTQFPGMTPLLPEATEGTPGVTATGDATVTWYRQTFPLAQIHQGNFNHPAAIARPDQELDVYDIRWGHGLYDSQLYPVVEGPNQVIFSFPTNVDAQGNVVGLDLRNAKALSLFLATDSSNVGFNLGDQAFTVELVSFATATGERDGATIRLDIPAGTPALTRVPGRFEQIEGFDGSRPIWFGFTPLGELRIPLDQIQMTGFNYAAITEIRLTFPEQAELTNQQGAIMLQNIYLIP